MPRSQRVPGRRALLPLCAAVALALVAGRAEAGPFLVNGIEINPAFLGGSPSASFSGWGLDPASAASTGLSRTRSLSDFDEAGTPVGLPGANFDIGFTLSNRAGALNDPQAGGGSASSSDPWIVDAQVEVFNLGDYDWFGTHIIIWRVADWDYSGDFAGLDGNDKLGWDVDPGPSGPFGAADNIILVDEDLYLSGNEVMAGVALGYIPAGGSAIATIRYVVAGNLPLLPGDCGTPLCLTVPTVEFQPYYNLVPEPGALTLLAVTASVFVALRRLRSS